MAFKNAKDVVIACENTLGFTHPSHLPLWKSRSIEAGKLLKAMAKNPRLYTFRNLELTIAWFWRQRKPITSPAALTWFVEDAIENANENVTVANLVERIDRAIAWEMENQLPDSGEWITRLTRSSGDGRSVTLNDWREARNG